MNILWYGFGAIAQNRLERVVNKSFRITKHYYIDPNVDLLGPKYEKISTAMLGTKNFDLCIFTAPWWHRDYSIINKIQCNHFYIEKPIGNLTDFLDQLQGCSPKVKVVFGYQRSTSDTLSLLKTKLLDYDYDTINVKTVAPFEKKYIANIFAENSQYNVLDEVGSHVLSQLCKLLPESSYFNNFKIRCDPMDPHCNAGLKFVCTFDANTEGNTSNINFFNSHGPYAKDSIVFSKSGSNNYLGYTFIGGDFCFENRDGKFKYFRGGPYSDQKSVSRLFELLINGECAPVYDLGLRTEKLIKELKYSFKAFDDPYVRQYE